MPKFTWKDETYVVKFQHTTEYNSMTPVGTKCEIFKFNTGLNKPLRTHICDGYSYLADGDMFNRKVGQTISLKRALNQMLMTEIDKYDWRDFRIAVHKDSVLHKMLIRKVE